MAGVYNIPSGYPFLESLANGLLQVGKADPFLLCQMEVFLPTRRACLELKNAFMRQGEGQCILLPKLSPLGDLEESLELLESFQDGLEVKPVVPPFKRLALLTNLIEGYAKKTGVLSSPALALKLAKSLVKLMDQAAIEKVPWEGLIHLVPSEFASHWQLTLNFLEIITTHWPHILEEKGFIEPYVRHHRLVEGMVARWEKTSPSHPIVAAGSTGTMPATAYLLQTIATLPQGTVLLPGLDTTLTAEEIETLSACHPQYALTRLLKKMALHPSSISKWPALDKQANLGAARFQLFAETLKPSFDLAGPPPDKALEGVYSIPCESPQAEALAISLLFRQQLEIPHQRIALVTSDLKLVERVTWELKRWGIEIDSSSGDSLDLTPSGVFLKLCAEFISCPHDQVALLSLLKHPFFRMGKPLGALRSEIYQLEKNVIRKNSLKMFPWVQDFYDLIHRFRAVTKAPFADVLTLHAGLTESLSMDDKGECQLWKGAKGEAVKTFFDDLQEASADFPVVSLVDYSSLLNELFKGQKLRFRPQRHPRLAILGPLEVRLFHADVMILGGLNEGTWPPTIDVDPWLNRPMRQDMGFPSPERRIGLSSHDFCQAFGNPKVYLTRALKVDGTPTIACRWLERLTVYLEAWGLSFPLEPRILQWVQQFDLPEKQEILVPPQPKPPVKARPRRLSVTQIETWMRDPYALYARHVLSLSPLDPLNAPIEAADRGTLIHNALDQFFKICPDPNRQEALDILLLIGKTLFEPYRHDPSARLYWWPRFCHLARWFIDYERATRLPGTQTLTEVRGKLTIETPLGPFECVAKADRIDLLPDGRLCILDYKTGVPPSDQDVQLGFSPQLPLEGAIALHQGFEGIVYTELARLQFWWLKGDKKGGIIKSLSGDPHDLSSQALAGLQRMILLFEDENTPYAPRPFPTKGLKYNDYAHLARLQEWGRL